MKSLWHECLLDDVLEFKNGKSLSNACYLEKAKYPVWGSNGIIAYCDKYLNNESVIVIGRVGAYCGSLNLVDGANWVTDNAIYAVPKLGNDIKFLYYLLVSLDIPRTAIGSAQPLLTQSGLKAIECKIPPLETQKEIAHILGTLDDKIELNRRMNKILEEIAQTLYKNWFIDFEFPNEEGKPYKSSGGVMVDSEIGQIPKVWRVRKTTDLAKIVGGATPSTRNSEYWDGDIPFITPKDLTNLQSLYLLKTERNITKEGAACVSSGLLAIDTILLSSRAPIGYIALLTEPSVVNQGFIALECLDHGYTLYVMLWVMNNIDIIKQYANGSTFLEINKDNFRKIDLLVPPDNIISKFNIVCHLVFQQLKQLAVICKQLSDTKNYLQSNLFTV